MGHSLVLARDRRLGCRRDQRSDQVNPRIAVGPRWLEWLFRIYLELSDLMRSL